MGRDVAVLILGLALIAAELLLDLSGKTPDFTLRSVIAVSVAAVIAALTGQRISNGGSGK